MNNQKKSKHLLLQARIRTPKSRYSGIHQFRTTIVDTNFLAAFNQLFPHKASLQDFHGAAFPKTAKQIFSNKVPKSPTTAYREILWSIARCLQFAEVLKEFCAARDNFEKEVLLSNLEAATNLLNHIEEKFGKSIWLYQNKMASAHISSNASWPSEVAANVLEEVRPNPILHPLMHYIRRRIESANLRDKLREEIEKQISSGVYSKYFLAKILDATNSNEHAVASLLFVDAQSSLIDHYSSLIVALQAAASDNMFERDMADVVLGGLVRLHAGTGDYRLIGIISCLGQTLAVNTKSSDTRESAIEAYTRAEYESCIKYCDLVLATNPLDSALRLLRLKAFVVQGKAPMHESGLCGDIHSHLFNILSANDQFFPSVHAMIVLADRFSDHHWMLYFRVAVWYEIGSEEAARVPSWMRDVYVRESEISPFAALAFQHTSAAKIIDTFAQQGRFPTTLALVQRILGGPTPSTVKETRVAIYVARQLISQSNYEEAASAYAIAAEAESRPALKLRCRGGQALALMLNGNYKEALDTVVEAFLSNQNAPLLLPFTDIAKLLPDADEWPNTINLSLMLAIAAQFDPEGDLSKIRLAFEKFCEDNEISTPATLFSRAKEFGENNVRAYLETVWQPQVMRQTLLYTSPHQIEEARIEACQALIKIDPKNARVHKEELASRIKQQEIANATALVEQSKVYVDIEAIKRSLRAKLKNSYAQYKNSVSQHEKQPSELLDKLQSVFENYDAGKSLATLFSSLHILDGGEAPTQADIQFSALFGEITKEFLTGDHGLNAYLSTRVRHGKLVDAVRKSVAEEHLVTARNDDGTYVPNDFWNEALRDSACRDDVLQALEKFTLQFDTTLFHARDKCIQIRTYYNLKASDDNTEALFNYQFSNLERRLLQSYDKDFKDFDELIIKCVDSLWEKTDANLEIVRSYLSGPLRSKLMEIFNDLSASIDSVCAGNPPAGIANAIARSRTAAQQSLDMVVSWFKRSEVYDRQDFDIDFPCQIAANMVNRTLSVPSGWAGPKIVKMTADAKMSGRALDALVDIFYVLFENAVKHAESTSIPLEIDVAMGTKAGEFSARVTSRAETPTPDLLRDLETLRDSLRTQESRRLAQNEGRSGFRKILLSLSSPHYKSPFLDFDHTIDGHFIVNFGFKISD